MEPGRGGGEALRPETEPFEIQPAKRICKRLAAEEAERGCGGGGGEDKS